MLGRSRTISLLLVVAALGGALVLKLAIRGRRHVVQRESTPWSDTREDRVMIIDLLDRLEAKDPSLHSEVEAAREQVLDDSRELVVGTTRLSNHFFDWDTLTQERVMLRAINRPSAITKKEN